MASDINTSFPPDNEQVSKTTMREQYVIIKDEIEDLQHKTSLAWQIATGVVVLSS